MDWVSGNRQRARVGGMLLRVLFAALFVAAFPSHALAEQSTKVPLGAREASLETELASLQTRLLYSEEAHDRVEADRDRALMLLTDHVVQVYRSPGAQGFGSLLASRSLADVIERGQLQQRLTDYEERLLASLDEAEVATRQGQEQTDELVAQLVSTQKSLIDVREELAAEDAKRDPGRSKKAPVPAATADEALVSFSTDPVDPISPSHVFGRSFGGGLSGGGFLGGGVVPGGASAEAIDAYLLAKGSPMVGNGVFFMASGAKWGLDPRLLVAISGAESSFGMNLCGPFNAWGWACPNNPAEFTSWADGIDTIAEGLRRYYVDEGRTTVASIHQKYAPNGAANDPTGLNNHWVGNVPKFLMELGGNPTAIAVPGFSSPVPDEAP